MNKKFILISLVFVLLGLKIGFSQTFNDRNNTVPLPENVKATAAKCNQTLFGANAFVFDPSMDMEEIQTLIYAIHDGMVFPGNEFFEEKKIKGSAQ